jgi:cyclic pyranopterin phosphate synthase
MVNITQKSSTLRKAVATAIVKTSRPETVKAVQEKKVPKGDVFEFSRAAGLLALKKTSDVIPDCHPLPVEFGAITFSIDGLNILISVEVHTIYKTGVEVEAMHGAAVTSLVIYDMPKPIDKEVEISTIKLQQKSGGKTDRVSFLPEDFRVAVIVCSDSVSSGQATDTSGKAIINVLKSHNLECTKYEVIPDDFKKIQTTATELILQNYHLVLFTGGTGVGPRDVTPDAIKPLLDKEVPGIMEATRQYGQLRTPYAMLSRGVAGFAKNTLLLTLPGSLKAVQENMDALFPHILHVFDVKRGLRHDQQTS